jgi:nucleoside-diphosphate-sugar epimerase
MLIAVTGASGHLGSVMVPFLEAYGHTVIPVGHEIDPQMDADALIHLAAPDHRDEEAIRRFYFFNGRVKYWADHHRDAFVINTGTWWQKVEGEALDMSYTRLKVVQAEVIGNVTLIPYSVYGHAVREDRGFIPQLVTYMRGGKPLLGASRQERDWVYVTDVCNAYLIALRDRCTGEFDVATGHTMSPHEIVVLMTGEDLPDYPEHPNCHPPVTLHPVPNWHADTSVLAFIDHEVGAHATP